MTTNTPKLFYRQKVLLALLQSFGGSLSNIDLQKYLFLFTQICQQEKSYEFVPYKFGCFSFQSYADRRRLIETGTLARVDNWKLASDYDFLAAVKPDERKKLELFHHKFAGIRGNNLVKEIYKKYPYYAIRSEIASDLMTDEELCQINAAVPQNDEMCFFTIGYEGISFENYLNRLILNRINTLVDVRKNPLSRKFGFSKSTLSDTLEKLDIEYLHLPELGIISEKRRSLVSQKDYDQLFDDYEKTVLKENKVALEHLYGVFVKDKRVAITCFEAEVCMCHRGRVAAALQTLPSWDYDIQHI